MGNAWEDEKAASKENSAGNHIQTEKLIPDTSSLIVKIIEDETNKLHTSLGLTDKDAKKIQERIVELLIAEDAKDPMKKNLATLLATLSKECVHANQLAYASFAVARLTADKKRNEGRSRIRAVEIGPDGKMTSVDPGEDIPDHIKEILKEILKRKGLGEDEF